ncbi:1,6-anhydro-N-acetylmuramyl-L-alanine amidase AmpD [Ferrovum myxofaciens]|uniref:1,6-anhydro-N-acetylmuramyl-L-alanine amidase AmpD n=1 Tax=Ferrovum myxofaciens TaxID=416213 RepID=UPI003EC0E7BC
MTGRNLTSPPPFFVDSEGWVRRACHCLSPNFDSRSRAGSPPTLVVIHSISLPAGQFGGRAVEDLFTNRLDPSAHPSFESLRDLRVSAHFLIRREGTLIQFVSTDARAWHAGVSQWGRRQGCNDFSLGIELEGTDHVPFTEAQYGTLDALLQGLCARYPIQAITGHSDVAPCRKTDPGPCFHWARWEALGYPVQLLRPKKARSG